MNADSTHHKLYSALLVPIAVVFMEVVLRISTGKDPVPSLASIVLWSVVAGCVLQLPCSLIKHEGARRALRIVILLLLGLIFSVQYFVFRKFKLFYDPKTILVGASDAMGQFGDSALALIMSPSGVAHLLLFFAPALIALVFTIYKPARELFASQHKQEIAYVLATGVLSYVVALALVLSSPNTTALWAERYNFQNAVSSFGLLTSLNKELQTAFTHSNESSFNSQGSFFAAAALQASGQQDAESTGAAEGAGAGAAEGAGAGGAKSAGEGKASDKDEGKSTAPSTLNIDFAALSQAKDNPWASVDAYVASIAPSLKNKYTGLFRGYNLIFISAEALSAEAIRPDTTPTLWRMAEKGIQLSDFYQFDSAGTTGGECANIFGLIATEGGSSVKLTKDHNNYLTMGNALNRLGYDGWAFHNNSYEFYDRHLTHNNLGYNHGYIAYGNGMEQWVQWQWPQSDLEMIKGTFDNLYGSAEHFNVYYMSVSAHSDYGPGENKMAEKNKDLVAKLNFSEPVKNYLAANIELDRAMEYLIGRLKEKGIDKKTVIVIAADHFPYGLDDDAPVGQLNYTSELYGYEIQDVFQRDHNRAIIWSASLEDKEPIVAQGPCSSIDLLPSLLNLFGCEWDSRLLPGRDVFSNAEPLVFDVNYNWKTALGTYWAASARFEPAQGAQVPEGYVETMSAVVSDKLSYCHAVLTTDYWRHVFGDPPQA